MDKAGIITWCNDGINYGQVLQAYAMQRIVRKYGINPVVFKYRRPKENEPIGKLRTSTMKQVYELLAGLSKAGFIDWKVKMKFNHFVRRHIELSTPCYTKEDIEKEFIKQKCTMLFCGSDQIWNPVAFDPVLYLDFGDKEIKRIAYAPSIAEDELSAKNRHIFEKMVALIEKIDFVSVREKSGEDILRQLTKKQIYTLLDPTFLLTQRGWDRIASTRPSTEDYIFCYVLGDIKQHREILQILTQKYRTTKIIYLSTKSSAHDSNEEFRKNVGIEEFVSLIKNAKAVYTDSFHGVAISINYNREFYTGRRFDINAYNKNSRINNILQLFRLEKRYIEQGNQIAMDDYISYDEVNAILRKERIRAFLFLDQAMKTESRG